MDKCFVCNEMKDGCETFADEWVKDGVKICPTCVKEWINAHLDSGGWLDDLEQIE